MEKNNIYRKTSSAEPHFLRKEEDNLPNAAEASSNSKSMAISQCQQLPPSVLNPVSPYLAQSFWLPHQHHGYGFHLPNGPPFHSFSPLATVDANWRAPVSGPWDPSSWWGQVQLSQHPLAYTIPGLYPQFSPQQPIMLHSLVPADQSSQRGIIRPLSKLSQKHQQMWEAQSAENVQLWTVIGQLQSEMADYKSKVMKLEAELSSVKQKMKDLNNEVNGTVVSQKPVKKRGRPKKSAASVDVSPSLDQGRKPRAPIFEKVILKQVHLSSVTQQRQEKASNCSQVHDLKAIMQKVGVDNSSLEMKYTNVLNQQS